MIFKPKERDEETERKEYRNNLVKRLKKARNGSLVAQICELFKDKLTKKTAQKDRSQCALDLLQTEKESPWIYQYNNKNVIWRDEKKIEQIKSLIDEEKLKRVECFKSLYPDFIPFLENNNFFSLVVGGATFEEIEKNDDKLKNIREIVPNKISYSFEYGFCWATWLGVKIFFMGWWKVSSIDVEQNYSSEAEQGDGSIFTDQWSLWETVWSRLDTLPIADQKYAIVTYNDDDIFSTFKQDMSRFNPLKNPKIISYITRIYPDFFKSDDLSNIQKINWYNLVNKQGKVLYINFSRIDISDFVLKEGTDVILVR